ncbi:FG-GAP repeat domain-containing protein [Aquipluma nitroreducens]|nr:VCBS repeat-containing protein [Aquipluma nitroreducens]
MMKEKTSQKKNKGLKNLIPILVILIVIVGIPLLFLNYQARRSGMSMGDAIKRITTKTGSKEAGSENAAINNSGEKIDFLTSLPIGMKFTEPPLISHLQAVDLDGDGLLDVIDCDAKNNTINWIRQYPAGVYTESILAGDLIAPAHIQAIDFDNDGDLDLILAVLGMLFPNNDKIGSVVILENDGHSHFTKHLVVDKIARVSDVRAGDLDKDGDMDLAVAQFGYDDGETRWIENMGGWKFKQHILQNLSGPINVEIVDVDNDGDLDIVSLVSQEWEEIYCFINDGKGNFQPKLIWGSSNQDYGSSGISMCDLDKDGDMDILYSNGDAFDYIPPQGRPWHGAQWLENKGDMKFEFHRLCSFTGATNVRAADIDNDGDLDLFVVSEFNLWDKPDSYSLIWLENTGNMQYTKHEITKNPTHILCCEPGDFNNDGQIDLVTGNMHTYPPFDRMGRITLWTNSGKLNKKK